MSPGRPYYPTVYQATANHRGLSGGVLLLAAFLLSGCDPSSSLVAPDRREFFLQSGIDQYERGDFPSAIRSFSKYLSFEPDTYGYWLRGRSFHEVGDRVAALKNYQDALNISPRDAFVLRALGWLHFTGYEFQDAVEQYEKAFQYDRNSPESLSFAAWSALGAGDYEKAVDLVIQAQNIIPWHDTDFYDGNDAAYNTIVAYLASKAQGQSNRAMAFVHLALNNASPNVWPYAALRYLGGQITEDELLYFAEDRGAQTEAHTYLAFDALLNDKQEKAQEHLDWIAEQGDDIYYEYYIALALRDGTLKVEPKLPQPLPASVLPPETEASP